MKILAMARSQLAVMCLFGSSVALAQDWCASMVTDNEPRVVEQMSKPATGTPYRDKAFGTLVTRITNAPAGTAHRTLYSTVQPWNADESYLMLYHAGDNDAGHHLYDGKSYQYIEKMGFLTADIEGIYWDKDDANILYFVQRRPDDDALYGQLVKYNVKTRQRSLAADLTTVCGDPRRGTVARGGNDIQGMQGDLIGLRCLKGATKDVGFTVNVKTGRIGKSIDLDPTRIPSGSANGFRPDIAPSPLPSKRVLVQDALFDSSMTFQYQLDGSKNLFSKSNGGSYRVPELEHSSVGRMPNGNDALFSPQYNPAQNGCDADINFGVGSLVAYDLSRRSCDVIVGPSTGWSYPLRGVHLSAVSQRNRGWVTMTTIGYRNLNYLADNRPAPVLFSELSLTYADPENPKTCRLAHLRTHAKEASRGRSYKTGYFGEPHAVMSPTGTRIIYNSDWHDSGSVDAYVVDLKSKSTTVSSASASPENQGLAGSKPGALKPENGNSVTDALQYQMSVDVKMNESPPRVYVDFMDENAGAEDRIAISEAGSPDTHRKMWLYTNGSQSVGKSGPSSGRLGFLQRYIGTGKFEARLYTNDDFDRVVHRRSFSISSQ